MSYNSSRVNLFEMEEKQLIPSDSSNIINISSERPSTYQPSQRLQDIEDLEQKEEKHKQNVEKLLRQIRYERNARKTLSNPTKKKILSISLVVVALTIGYPIYNLYLIFTQGDEQAPIFKIYLNIYFIFRCIFNFSTTFALTYQPGYRKVLGPLYKNVTKFSKSDKVFPNCFLTIPFTLILSCFYSYVMPAIHPDYKTQNLEWAFPITYPIFIVNLLYFFYIQLFWSICYKIEKRCQFLDFFYTQNTLLKPELQQKAAISTLEKMKYLCKDSLTVTEHIDDCFGWFTTFLFCLAFFGLLIPVNVFRHSWKNRELELNTKRYFAIMLWIFASSFLLLHTIFRAIKIPQAYYKTVKSYSINVGAKKEFRTKEFIGEYEIVKKELFSQSPHLMFAGLTPINMSFLAVAFLIQILNLIWQWSDLVPYQGLSNGTLGHQYQPYLSTTL